MKKTLIYFLGVLIGIINILIGACGGIIAVEALKKSGLDQTKAHATAIAVILPLTVISAVIYILQGKVSLSDSYIYLIPGLAGSFAGACILPKIPKKVLSKIFSCFMIYAGVRMLMK